MRHRVLVHVLLAIILLLALPIDIASGSTSSDLADVEYVVSPTGSGDACTRGAPCSLQRALELADAAEIATITMLAGTYASAHIGVSNLFYLVIRGDAGTRPSDVVIDAQGEAKAILITNYAANARIDMQGLTLQGAASSGLDIRCDQADQDVFLKQVIIQNNATTGDGGGLQISASPNNLGNGNALVRVVIEDSIIRDNQAARRGGGIAAFSGYGESFVQLELHNTLMYGNRAGWTGGGIDLMASELGEDNEVLALINHSTLTDNVADAWQTSGLKGGGINARAYSGVNAEVNCQVYSSIIWGNRAGNGQPQDILLSQASAGENGRTRMAVSSSDIGEVMIDQYAGTPEYSAWASISADPQFIDRAGGDYRLPFLSPCVDSAYRSPYISMATVDLDGLPRPAGPLYDMGAYEFQSLSTYLPMAMSG